MYEVNLTDQTWIKEIIGWILPRSRFIKNVALLTAGTAFGQMIIVLVSPILTRLYAPEDFGLFAIYMSIISIIAVIASWRYELAIVLPEKDDDAFNLLLLCLGIVMLMGILMCIVTWLMGERIVDLMNILSLKPYLWMLPLGFVIVGIYQILNYWAVRKEIFKKVSISRVYQSIVASVMQLILGIFGFKSFGLLLGQLLGQMAGVWILAMVVKNQKGTLSGGIRFSRICIIAKRYIRFPMYTSWSGVLNALSFQIPILMLSLFFEPHVIGLYALSYRILWTPIQLVGQSAGQVFLNTAAKFKHQEHITFLTKKFFNNLVYIGIPCFLFICIFAPDIFSFIFGEDWRKAGVYTRWLTPWLFLVFISSPLSVIILIMDKQKQDAFFQVTLLAGRTSLLLVGGLIGSPDLAIGLFASVSAFFWFILMLWIMKISGNKLLDAIRFIILEFIKILPIILFIMLLKLLNIGIASIFIGFGILGFLVTYRILKIQREMSSYE